MLSWRQRNIHIHNSTLGYLKCFFFCSQFFSWNRKFKCVNLELLDLKLFISHMLPKYVHVVFALATGLIKASCECFSPCKVVTRAIVKFVCKWKGFNFPRGKIKNIRDKQQQLKLSGEESGRMPTKCSVPEIFYTFISTY
jgi:hypothetical protein